MPKGGRVEIIYIQKNKNDYVKCFYSIHYYLRKDVNQSNKWK